MTRSPYTHPRRVRRVLESLVAVVCPPEASECGLAPAIADRVEASMGALPSHIRAGLISGLLAYEASAAFVPRHRGRPASGLSAEHAARYFEAWWKSELAPRRELAKGVKGLLCLACYETPEMKAELNYRPEAWIARVKQTRLQRHGDAIARQDAALARPDPLPAAPGSRP